MSGRRLLGDIQSPNLLSRRDDLAVSVGVVIDGAVHEDEMLKRGYLLAKIIASGKYRAYAEADVAVGGDFSTGADTFTLEAGQEGAKHFRVGDVLESVAGAALGTIATYNPATGAGTLTGNSSNNLADGNGVRITEASVSLGSKNGRVLKNEMVIEGTEDKPEASYSEGFFTEARIPNLTDAAKTSLGTSAPSSGELRLL